MFLFHALYGARRSRSPIRRHPRPTMRPQVEALEDRLVMNNRFVVPVGVPADNAATFNTLKGALTTGVLSAGDVIQIEPGSTPGNIVNADLPVIANLTLQGDSAAALVSIPMFTVSDQASLPNGNAGFTLKNVNVGLIGTGSFKFFNSTTITGCSIVDISSTNNLPIFFAPGAANNVVNTVTNSTFTLAEQNSATLVLVAISSGTGCSNVFLNNVFTAHAGNGGGSLLNFTNSSNVQSTTNSDLVANNTFIGEDAANLGALFDDSATATGLTVRGNSFSDPDFTVIAIKLHPANLSNLTQLTYVYDNTINLPNHNFNPNVNAVGIEVDGSTSVGSTVAVFLHNNRISTSRGTKGTGLLVNAGTTPTTGVFVQAQANDFHTNDIGVKVVTDAVSTATNLHVDLGGGPSGFFAGSLGDNNFRGLGAASATKGPIVVAGSNPATALTVFAKNNLFSNTPPVSFKDAGLTNVSVDSSGALTGNAAFVETLYVDYLHRTGDTAPGGDAVVWVNAINNNQLTLAQVANGIIHSAEALGVVVDGLYLKFLGRTADAGGRTQFVNFLVGGGTLEQATAILISSPEYNARAGSDTGFVQNLYANLLGRIPNNAETTSWLSVVASQGRAAVANALLSSSEYRSLAVQQMYGFVTQPAISEASLFYPALHRTLAPAASEIASWANSALDLLAIETALVGGSEFFTNG